MQSKSQLKAIYKDNADTIEGNCDTTLFLGGKEKTTLKEMAEILGKETIDLYNTSDTRGTSQSYGLNYQKTGKEFPDVFRIKRCTEVSKTYEMPKKYVHIGKPRKLSSAQRENLKKMRGAKKQVQS